MSISSDASTTPGEESAPGEPPVSPGTGSSTTDKASSVFEVLEPVALESGGAAIGRDVVSFAVSLTGAQFASQGRLYNVRIRQLNGEGGDWNWHVRGGRSAKKLQRNIQNELQTMSVDEFRQKRQPKPKPPASQEERSKRKDRK